MMIQLILLVTYRRQKLAYRFASTHYQEIEEQEKKIGHLIKNIPLSFSIHTLSTSDASLEALKEKDPYFKDVQYESSLESFISDMKSKSELNDEDIASYLQTKYHLDAFSLQKVLYYGYAGFLTEFHQRPFNAQFIAFSHGPVDYGIWKRIKYSPETLNYQFDFLQKIASKPKIKQYLDGVVEKYGQYFQKTNSFKNDDENPTHNLGTPWSRAYAKGQNTTITDDDILKYHYLEKID